MSRILPLLTLLVAGSLAACGDDSDKVQILLFQASPDAIEAGQSTKLVFAVEPSTAKITIAGLGDVTGKTEAQVSPTDTTTYQLTATFGKAITNQTVKVTVGPTSAAAIKVEPATKTPTAGDQVPVTLSVLGPSGNPAPGFRGTLHITSTDASAVLPPDITFTAAEAGTKQVMVMLKTAGVSTLTATDTTGRVNASGSASLTVQPAAAHSYRISALPAGASAGDALVLTITVLDVFGNVATSYGGRFHVTSTDSSDVLPPDGAFTAGVQTVSLAFTRTGNHIAQINDAAGSLPSATTSSIAIGPAAAARVALNATNSATTAGTAEPLTITVFDRFGNLATNYTGTVHFTSTDASAVLPADFTFASTDAGTHAFNVTLKTAGASTVTATDAVTGALTGSAAWSVSPANASAFALSPLPASATAGDALVLAIAVKDAFGNLVAGFGGQAQVTSGDGSDVLPPVGGFTGGVRTVSVTFTKAGNHTATVSDPANVIAPATTSTVSLVAGRPNRVALTTVNPTTTAGANEQVTARVVDQFGNTCLTYLGTVHFSASDPRAVLPPDFTFSPLDAGIHAFGVVFKTAGPQTATVADTALPAVGGIAAWAVSPAAASAFQLTALPASATAGQALVLTITVQDAFGNVATTFGGQAQVTSGDRTDVLPPVGGFVAGVRTVSVEFTKTGSHTATVSDPASVVTPATTTSVAVSAASPFRVAVTTPSTATTAGSTETVSTSIVDFFDNTCLSYTGTLHFAATDPQAVVPPDFTFTAGDAGAHSFGVTLKTSGSTTLAISDTGVAGLSGTATWQVGAAAATTCVASQAPTTATAGTVIGLTVAVRDPFGNVANGYAGTVQLSASDARANLPGAVTYVPSADAGSHAFSVALLTTGSQTVTATDTVNPAISCNLGIAITPAAPKLVLSIPPDANAGYAVNVGVNVKDLFDNAIPTYAGTVTFTSTDNGTGAQTPAPITFTGSEGGVTTTTATFVTIGTQTLSGTASGTPQALGSVVAKIHGLVYTAPGAGRVRLVANSAQSSAQTVQLDLVASERLEVSTFFGGPGSFSAGMNLPLDTTRVGAGSPLFTRGTALPVGTGVAASMGVLGSDHVLYTGVSRKRVTGTAIVLQDTQVEAGQVFYSVRLKVTQNGAVGTVFDGAQPMAMFRAAVRDQFGDDFVGQGDIGVGKLEIR